MDSQEKRLLAEKLGDLGHAPLEAIASMTHGFASSLDINETLRTALQESMRYLDAEAGSVFLLDEDGENLECRASAGPVDITGLRLPSDKGIIGEAVQQNQALIIRDVSKSDSFNVEVDSDTGFVTRSILCAPLAVRDRRLGALELINKQGDDALFSERDRNFLIALASAASLALQNARMAADLVEQEKVRKEMELAREIQRSLLPEETEPDAPVHGLNIPARGVSGDLYLFFPLPDGKTFFALGDVSGKGMHAALFMAKTVSLIRALAKLEQSPARLLPRLNDEIAETSSRGMFVTLVAGVYDPETETVCLANAGHEPPLYRSADGEYSNFPADGPPLGILPDLSFEEVDIPLQGGALYIYTDGLTEGFGEDGNPMEVAGVKEAIEKHRWLSPLDRIQSMVNPLVSPDTPLRDDVTLMVIDGGASCVLGRMVVPALPEHLKELRDHVRELLVEREIDNTLVEQLILVVGEAIMNVVVHGFDGGEPEGRITLEVREQDDELIFRLKDNAPSVDPEQIKHRDLEEVRPGGLGTYFMKELMDSVEFLPPPMGSGNLLEMRKRIK